jgi:hypothetical protein
MTTLDIGRLIPEQGVMNSLILRVRCGERP